MFLKNTIYGIAEANQSKGKEKGKNKHGIMSSKRNFHLLNVIFMRKMWPWRGNETNSLIYDKGRRRREI
jgi:hypothetical protein